MVKPWYKQFWPWFLIALPMTVVVWTVITVTVFTQNSVHLVTEDYYKKGKGINIDLSKIKVSEELGLKASIESESNSITIKLDKGELPHFPAIKAMFVHRTLPDRDFTELLTADAKGNYRVTPSQEIQGPWFIEITPHNEEWLIQGRVNFPTETTTDLMN
ncbi:hypothetical protein EK599_19525 [Vibrio sp. T187]|uniref:FixH family protein n=1 Tax=Vibrio TaxID=662 RepID=UPI0010C9DFFA|nr:MULTISPECIES: FixH family protein [Vibrio]MBW3697878.1 hypothetical protein [Vibrio sp. T187]